MRVLVATSATQGAVPGDFCGTVEGELVLVEPVVECGDSVRCGCGRGFPGLASARSTTTAMVVERPLLTRQMVNEAIRESLDRQGWLRGLEREEIDEGIEEELVSIEEAVAPYPDGTVLARSGRLMWPRHALAA